MVEHAAVLGYTWVADGGGGLHLEFLIQVEILVSGSAGAREAVSTRETGASSVLMVQRRYRDFCLLHAALAKQAAGAVLVGEGGHGAGSAESQSSVSAVGGWFGRSGGPSSLVPPTVPALPARGYYSGRRNLSGDFGARRRAELHLWLAEVLAIRALGCGALDAFLGAAPPPPSQSQGGMQGVLGMLTGGASTRVPAASAPPAAPPPPPSGAELERLSRLAGRMRGLNSGLVRDASGAFKGSAAVRWLVAQALASSLEGATELAEAMRRAALLKEERPTGGAAQRAFATTCVYAFVS